MAVDESGTAIVEDLLGGPLTRYDDGPGSYAAPDAEFDNTAGYERIHSMSEIISSIIDAGLSIEHFREFDATPAPTPSLERGPDRLYRFPQGAVRYPLTFSIRARKPN